MHAKFPICVVCYRTFFCKLGIVCQKAQILGGRIKQEVSTDCAEMLSSATKQKLLPDLSPLPGHRELLCPCGKFLLSS
jgi:hypothetical protein